MAECVPTPEPLEQSTEQYEDDSDPQLDDEDEEILSSGLAEVKMDAFREKSKYIKLNVGGALFTTTLRTLLKEDNMLRAMFSGRMEVQTDEEGNSFI